MSEVKARVSTGLGQTIGYFVNPTVKHLCENDYEIRGKFVDESGNPYDKVEFNPEVLPYIVDLSNSNCEVKNLVRAYVQKGRQPVVMTAVKG